jgi:hypothetical protein
MTGFSRFLRITPWHKKFLEMNRETSMRNIGRQLLRATVLSILMFAGIARADVITEWNAHLEQVIFATAEPIPAQPRSAAIFHTAIFDAVNGIARKYEPFFVKQWAPEGARQEAAAVQAAYSVLVVLYPSQKAVLDGHLASALSNIPGHQGNSQSIANGRAWGA